MKSHGDFMSTADWQTLAVGANSKAILTFYRSLLGTPAYNFADHDWLSEIGRLRSDLLAVCQSITSLDPTQNIPWWKIQVSGERTAGDDGKWPITRFSQAGITGYYKSMDFYYPASAPTGSVRMSGSTSFMASQGQYDSAVGYLWNGGSTFDGASVAAPLAKGRRVTRMRCYVIVGGNQIVTLSGEFSFSAQVRWGHYRQAAVTASGGTYQENGFAAGVDPVDHVESWPGTDPTGLLGVDASHWLAGSWSNGYENGNVVARCSLVNANVGPGRYYVDFTITTSDDAFSALPEPYGWLATLNSSTILLTFPGAMEMRNLVFSHTVAGGNTWPGIHDSLPSWKLEVHNPNGEGIPFGFYGVGSPVINSGALVDPDVAPIFGNEQFNSPAIHYEPSVPGIFCATTQPINDLAPLAEPPWVVHGLQPPVWTGNAVFRAGTIIVDRNLNLQRALSTFTTGSAEPTWKTNVGETTADAAGLWQLYKIVDPPFISAQNLPETKVPRFPWFRAGDPAPVLGAFSVISRVVYGVNVNKQGTGYAGDVSGPPLPVEVGCMRNGEFVSFQTIASGIYAPVFWPVFTNDSLAYRTASGGLADIQAWSIGPACGAQAGGGVNPPLAAPHYNDLQSLLDLLT